jgi:hypothetical protein
MNDPQTPQEGAKNQEDFKFHSVGFRSKKIRRFKRNWNENKNIEKNVLKPSLEGLGVKN